MDFARGFTVLALSAASISPHGTGCSDGGSYQSPVYGPGGGGDAGSASDSGGDDATMAADSLVSTAPASSGSGMTDMQCQAMTSQSCLSCCASNHPDAYYTFFTAMFGCACGADGGGGVCAQPCATEYCAQTSPSPGDLCAACLAASVEQDAGGQCLGSLAAACPAGGPCDAYLTCANYCP